MSRVFSEPLAPPLPPLAVTVLISGIRTRAVHKCDFSPQTRRQPAIPYNVMRTVSTGSYKRTTSSADGSSALSPRWFYSHRQRKLSGKAVAGRKSERARLMVVRLQEEPISYGRHCHDSGHFWNTNTFIPGRHRRSRVLVCTERSVGTFRY